MKCINCSLVTNFLTSSLIYILLGVRTLLPVIELQYRCDTYR